MAYLTRVTLPDGTYRDVGGGGGQPDAVVNITRSDLTFTATRADGTTFTFTQQDNMRDPATAAPLMDGTANVGDSMKYAREDHVHPSDTTKVDKEAGKGLSTNDFTTALLNKLNGIEAGAEVNVQSDWNVTNTSSDAYIKNKPAIPTKTSDLTNDSNFVSDANYVHTDNNFTTTLKNKLNGIAAGAEVNVQSDWNETDTSSDAYIKNKPTIPADTWKAYSGTCSTAAATAKKAITVSSDQNFSLRVGTVIGVKFTVSNTAENVTLNVNSTGAKSIWYNTAVYTGKSTDVCGYANRVYYYLYDGTYWCWLGFGIQPNSNTVPTAYCTTAAGTAAKAATCTNYVLTANTYIPVLFTNANSVSGAITLNINGKGAKPIYINGEASSASNHTLPAGPYISYYDGTAYHLRTDGKLPASISGDAATVNGHTVAVDVPSGAKFTDTTYTAGANVQISSSNVISATDTTYTPASATPLMDGTGAVGTSEKYAREDHVHPSDTTKVDKETGKGLSTNDFTTTLLNKLNGIADGAEVNVQSDWNESSSSSDAYIKNKPTIPTKTSDLTNDSDFVSDSSYVHTDNNFTTTLKDKLDGIADGAEVNVQADWNVTDTASDAFIKNKPAIPTKTSDLTNDSDFVSDPNYVHTDNNLTNTLKNKLDGIESGAEVNVQADWNETNTASDAYIKNKPTIPTDTDTWKVYYGTCTTAAGTAAKVVTIAADQKFTLRVGTIIGVKYSNTNTANNCTINVNSTGAKSVWYDTSVYTGHANQVMGYANKHIYYMYDGTHWVWVSAGVDLNSTYTPASAAPLMDGTAAVGSSAKYAREDHVHPSDTSKVDNDLIASYVATSYRNYDGVIGGLQYVEYDAALIDAGGNWIMRNSLHDRSDSLSTAVIRAYGQSSNLWALYSYAISEYHQIQIAYFSWTTNNGMALRTRHWWGDNGWSDWQFINATRRNWTDASLTYSSYVTEHQLQMELRGETVFLSGYIRVAASTPVDTTLFTLPSGFRPVAQWVMLGQQTTGTDINKCRNFLINTNGTVVVHNGSALANTYFRLSVAFPVNAR